MKINPNTLEALRDPRTVEIRERHFARLQALFDGELRGQPLFLHGVAVARTDAPPNWEAWLPEALDSLAERYRAGRHTHLFRPLILCWDPHGVHFIDELFGAEVFMLEAGWQARPLSTPIGELKAPNLKDSLTWREVRRFTRAFLDLKLDAATLSLPTIASPLNIAVNLYGERMIMAMMVEPEAARHDLRVITDVLCAIHRWYLDNVPLKHMQCIAAAGRTQPRGHGQVCGCTTQLLSPQLYEEFIAPLDEEILSIYPHGGLIHLCGAHVQHMRAWRQMKALRAVQMNHRAAEDVGAYYEGLRPDQILYVHPFEKMPVDRVVELTEGGNRTVICAGVEAVKHLFR